MKRRGLILSAVLVAALAASGVVVASALQDTPQDAPRPAADPIADLIRQTAPTEPVPAGSEPTAVASDPALDPEAENAVEGEGEEDKTAEATPAVTEPEKPVRRQRRRIAIVQAIDKVTAESYRFEVEVGGRPVRFNQSLIFTARACEVTPPEERLRDAVAYLEISLQPRGTAQPAETRQIFRGWMFASAPAVSGLHHPVYDAWVVGCKA
ncbi:DUF2155 domain-containing protein [Rhizobium sp. CRIBSB]|nr:DUF2155 domain-containing protein [Rhizobium sp. CRIBSB]